ncbi:MAG TPA: hypothetical protein VFB78_08330 [Acidimicrobiales bacterium]|nr:hypothetical protein [Acidimicrobiales bacterium]
MTGRRGGVDSLKRITRTASGWRCELTPKSERARELMPDQPIVGFGTTEDEASWDAIQAFARSLNKLTPEQRDMIMTTAPVGGRLIGAASNDDHAITADERAARNWADQRRGQDANDL